MASFVDRLILQVDAITNGARTELDKLDRTLTKSAKSGGEHTSMMSKVSEKLRAIPPNAVLAGSAVLVAGKIAYDAATKFVNLAKASIDFAAASGLSTEEASRWIAVGDDYGLTAEQMATGVGKISKVLATTPQKFTDLGVAVEDVNGQTRPLNDILIDTLVALGKIPNATDRAAAGNKIFGRGFATLAPIIGSTREEYVRMLGAVSDGQVITEKEAEKAEKLRLAQDRLSDALGDLQLALGQVVADIAPAVEGFAALLEILLKLDPVAKATANDLSLFSGPVQIVEKMVSQFKSALGLDIEGKIGPQFDHIGKAVETSAGFVDGFAKSITDAGTAESETETITKGLAATAKELTKHLDEARKATEDLYKANVAYADNQQTLNAAGDDYFLFLSELPGKLAEVAKSKDSDIAKQVATNDLMREGVDKAKAWAEAYVAAQRDAGGATYDGVQAQKDYTAALLYTAQFQSGPGKKALLRYVEDINRVPTERRTEFEAVVDAYGAQAAQLWLDNIAKERDAMVNPKLNRVAAGVVAVGMAALALTKTATVNTHADTSAAERALSWLIRDRHAYIYTHTIPALAGGGYIPTGGMGLVSEYGQRELVNGRVTSRPTLVSGPAAVVPMVGGGGTRVIINMPTGTRPEDVAAAIRRYDIRNATTGTLG